MWAQTAGKDKGNGPSGRQRSSAVPRGTHRRCSHLKPYPRPNPPSPGRGSGWVGSSRRLGGRVRKWSKRGYSPALLPWLRGSYRSATVIDGVADAFLCLLLRTRVGFAPFFAHFLLLCCKFRDGCGCGQHVCCAPGVEGPSPHAYSLGEICEPPSPPVCPAPRRVSPPKHRSGTDVDSLGAFESMRDRGHIGMWIAGIDK